MIQSVIEQIQYIMVHEMKNISFVCPQCGSTIIADGSYCGQLIRCTSCNHRVLIPESAQPLPEEISADVEVSKNNQTESICVQNFKPSEIKIEPPMVQPLGMNIDCVSCPKEQYDLCKGQWKRIFARIIDMELGYIILDILIFMLLPAKISSAIYYNKTIAYSVGTATLTFLTLCLENACYCIFKWTPGKALFGIRIINDSGNVLTPKEYFKRSMGFYFWGFGMGIPFVNFIAFRELELFRKNQQSTYDTKLSYKVVCVKRGKLKKIILSFFGLVATTLMILLMIYLRYNDISTQNLQNNIKSLNPEDKYKLGQQYIDGNGVEQDQPKGFNLILEAAQKGHSESMIAVASYYLQGIGTPKNISVAIEWLNKAAQDYNPYSYIILSNVYFGNWDKKYINYDKAFFWSQKASDAGLTNGHINLALCYLNGLGCPTDRNKAFDLINQAAQKGSDWAKKFIRNNSR